MAWQFKHNEFVSLYSGNTYSHTYIFFYVFNPEIREQVLNSVMHIGNFLFRHHISYKEISGFF